MKECFSFNRNSIRSRRWILIFHRVEKVESIFRSKKIFVENSFPRFWHFKPSRVQTDFSFKILVSDVNNNNSSSNNNNNSNNSGNDNNSSSFGCFSNLWNGIPVETKPKNRWNFKRVKKESGLTKKKLMKCFLSSSVITVLVFRELLWLFRELSFSTMRFQNCLLVLATGFSVKDSSFGFELKQCDQVSTGSKPVLCSNDPDYMNNELPPGTVNNN